MDEAQSQEIKKMLVVEDEEEIADLIAHIFSKENFRVDKAYSGETALQKLEKEIYDVVILDLMLPKIQGLEICKYIRSNPELNGTAVIILTVKSEEVDKVLGLELGADDYITKPFSPRELVARVKAVLRRYKSKDSLKGDKVLKFGDLVIDKEKYRVYKKNNLVNLSPSEFKILLFLAENPHKVFSREEILKQVWQEYGYINPRTIDVHIKRIREKIEDNPKEPKIIKTMRGVGYYFSP